MTSSINVADVERWASAIGGAALTAYGIKQLKGRSPSGAASPRPAAPSCIGAPPVTAQCIRRPVSLQLTTPRDSCGAGRSAGRANVEEVVTINAPADQLFRFWRNLEQLPRFMDHLVSVRRDRSNAFRTG